MKRFLLSLMTCFCALAVNAQATRNFVKRQIEEWGQCRNVAITKTNGDIALYGKNGWAMKGCPKNLEQTINNLNEEGAFIDDVQLTEQGRWVIVYGKNGVLWNEVPEDLEEHIRDYNDNDEAITTVTFNDEGEWILISTENISTSDDRLTEWLEAGMEKHGKLWTACLTDEGCVAVFEDGYEFLGDVPDSLIKALKKTDKNVYRLKIAGDSWFFADKDENCEYFM